MVCDGSLLTCWRNAFTLSSSSFDYANTSDSIVMPGTTITGGRNGGVCNVYSISRPTMSDRTWVSGHLPPPGHLPSVLPWKLPSRTSVPPIETVKVCTQRMNWTEVKSSCECAYSTRSVQSARTDWASTVPISLQPVKSRRRLAWPMKGVV